MNIAEHLFVSDCDGALYDTRADGWSRSPPLRPLYRYHKREIRTVAEFKATLRAGPAAWPGGYPLYFITSDGAALSFESARAEFRLIADSIQGGHSDGWRVVACDINFEDSTLVCDHSGERIESAYGES
jgi:hypothetical protein